MRQRLEFGRFRDQRIGIEEHDGFRSSEQVEGPDLIQCAGQGGRFAAQPDRFEFPVLLEKRVDGLANQESFRAEDEDGAGHEGSVRRFNDRRNRR